MRAATVVQQLCKSCRTCFKFYCMFYFTCDRSFTSTDILDAAVGRDNLRLPVSMTVTEEWEDCDVAYWPYCLQRFQQAPLLSSQNSSSSSGSSPEAAVRWKPLTEEACRNTSRADRHKLQEAWLGSSPSNNFSCWVLPIISQNCGLLIWQFCQTTTTLKNVLSVQKFPRNRQGAITSKIKHAIKLKTSPARLAQLLHTP